MAWCSPELEFSKDVFSPGEEVTGRAWVSTKKDMTARNVTITFSGKTVTAWKQGEKQSEIGNTTCKRSEEVYVNMSQEVWKAEDEKNTFPAGDYEWNFSFELPKDCPASFEGYYGFIRYYVKLNIDVPNWPDTHFTKAVTVSPTIDLNLIPGANGPTSVQLENPVQACCGCIPVSVLKKGNVLFTLSAPTLGYLSGQVVTVTGLVENHSTRTLQAIEGSLHRMVIYREDLEKITGGIIKMSSNPNRRDDSSNSQRQIVNYSSKEEECQVSPGFAKEFTFSFEIPPVVATIRNSKFISVEYFVRITADVEGYSCSQAMADMNIVVGNVPLADAGGIEALFSSALAPTFRKTDAANRWSYDLNKAFHPLVPYFGNKPETPEA